ncbi:hypothetical protein [Ruania alba]|uniref:Secreted protein n=1 Tax=Ruania alba TaxID=648782 RepID=A0A1H5CSG9_9MICO|nr:hypothetical protein [Ruania alba]SED69454.1 hypothetical protein SAMN04488554_0454 [Ruania alba]
MIWVTAITWMLLGVCAFVACVAVAVSSGQWQVTFDDPSDPDQAEMMESRVTPGIEWDMNRTTGGSSGEITPATTEGASRTQNRE